MNFLLLATGFAASAAFALRICSNTTEPDDFDLAGLIGLLATVVFAAAFGAGATGAGAGAGAGIGAGASAETGADAGGCG
jgi:hypothetical protein